MYTHVYIYIYTHIGIYIYIFPNRGFANRVFGHPGKVPCAHTKTCA